jgi:hypothetical protein
LDLPTDIIYKIIDDLSILHLIDSAMKVAYLRNLHCLSLTCKKLRYLVLPSLFSHTTIPSISKELDLWVTKWNSNPYSSLVRSVRLKLQRSRSEEDCNSKLISALETLVKNAKVQKLRLDFDNRAWGSSLDHCDRETEELIRSFRMLQHVEYLELGSKPSLFLKTVYEELIQRTQMLNIQGNLIGDGSFPLISSSLKKLSIASTNLTSSMIDHHFQHSHLLPNLTDLEIFDDTILRNIGETTTLGKRTKISLTTFSSFLASVSRSLLRLKLIYLLIDCFFFEDSASSKTLSPPSFTNLSAFASHDVRLISFSIADCCDNSIASYKHWIEFFQTFLVPSLQQLHFSRLNPINCQNLPFHFSNILLPLVRKLRQDFKLPCLKWILSDLESISIKDMIVLSDVEALERLGINVCPHAFPSIREELSRFHFEERRFTWNDSLQIFSEEEYPFIRPRLLLPVRYQFYPRQSYSVIEGNDRSVEMMRSNVSSRRGTSRKFSSRWY